MRRNVRTFKAKNHAPRQLVDEMVYRQRRPGANHWDVYFTGFARDHTTLGTPGAPIFLRTLYGQ